MITLHNASGTMGGFWVDGILGGRIDAHLNNLSMSNLNLHQVIPDNFKLSDYPALTVGLIPFTFLLLVVDIISNYSLSHYLSLYPFAPFKLDLNALSFYVVVHKDFFHWLFNIMAIVTPMYYFEKENGTVNTGITLNLLAVTSGLQYCIVGLILYRNTHVIGLSGIVFLFMTYYAVKEHSFKPILYQTRINNRDIVIPTLYSPFISLLIVTLIFPGSSFFGHLSGISSGYLLGFGKLNILYPPMKVILFIESKLSKLIGLLDGLVNFISEEDGINLRNASYKPIFSQDFEAGITSATDSETAATFRGEGHVVGH